MATKKKLLQAAAGSAGGGEALNVEDVFSTYVYEGNGQHKAIVNGINLGQSNSGGSAFFNNNNTLDVADSTDFHFGGGDWTVEAFTYAYLGTDDFTIAGWGEDLNNRFDFGWQSSSQPRIRIGQAGTEYLLEASTSYALSNYVGTWVHTAAVRNGNTITLYIDGTSVGTLSYSETDFPEPSTGGIGIGSRWYTGRTNITNEALGYISNFRIVKGTAVYTSNFTAPTSALTAITNTSLLCLQGSDPLTDVSGNTHTLTQNQYNGAGYFEDGSDVKASIFGPFDAADAGEGGLVWVKQRTGTSSQHALFDTENGTLKALASSSTAALATEASVTSFNANGFSLGNFNNTSGQDYASWTFRKAPKFFDVVTYTGTGSAQNISHNLGTTVGSIFVKRTDSAASWAVYHRLMYEGAGATAIMFLNESYDPQIEYTYWNNTEPTDSQFTVGVNALTNASGGTYVAYLFAHNDGDGEFGPDADADIIKCGSYTGNGSSTGPEIDLGFEPQWLLIKGTSASDSWAVFDVMRGMTVGASDSYLFPNSSGAELSYSSIVRPTPTGFQLESVNWNTNTNNYIYIAIRRGPMAVPEDATDVFDVTTGSSSDPSFTAGFTVDFGLTKEPSTSAYSFRAGTRLLQGTFLETANTNAEAAGSSYQFDYQDSWHSGSLGSSWYSWMWKRAPNFFDVVAYTGNGTAGRTVSHNLGVAPEMMWVKQRNTVRNWAVYHSGTGNTKHLELNTSDAAATDTHWNNTTPTSTEFTLGTNTRVNESAGTYIAYLFASLDGVSKVGSFSHTFGTDTTVDCGFNSGARFVIVKRSSDSGDWMVFDTERGIVAGNDARLQLNDNAAEATNADNIDPNSSGFVFTGANGGGTYIFYAIA